jgi:hypothetical protein
MSAALLLGRIVLAVVLLVAAVAKLVEGAMAPTSDPARRLLRTLSPKRVDRLNSLRVPLDRGKTNRSVRGGPVGINGVR